MHLVAASPALRREIEVNGRIYRLSEYIGRSPKRGRYVEGAEAEGDAAPQGFLVEQPAGAVTPPHFHEHDQFQVVVEGFGYFGKRPAAPLTVQFAAGHTPYGPITAGPEGVVYFTLRRKWDPGAKYMPASRDKLRPPPRRSRIAGPFAPEAAQAGVEVLLAPEADGLAAWRVAAGPGGALRPPAPAGNGQYHVVLKGEAGGLPRHACAFLPAGAPAPEYAAGPEGAELLVVQFPEAGAR